MFVGYVGSEGHTAFNGCFQIHTKCEANICIIRVRTGRSFECLFGTSKVFFYEEQVLSKHLFSAPVQGCHRKMCFSANVCRRCYFFAAYENDG